MLSPILLANAEGYMLVGWWWALLMYVPFIPWAWLVSAKLDKDARYYHFNHRMWNTIQMSCGAAALAAMLFVPVPGLSVVVGILLLGAPVLVYWKYRNANVAEHERFHLTSASLQDKILQRRQAKATRAAVLSFSKSDGDVIEPPMRDDPIFETHILVEDLIGPSLEARASRIHLGIGPKGTVVGHTIDGIKYKREPIGQEAAVGVMDLLKSFAGLDLEDRRRRQTGQFKVQADGSAQKIDLEVSGSSSGIILTMYVDRARQLSKPLDGLGLLPQQLEVIRSLDEPQNRSGIVLVGAPPGHGLTTSCYSLLSSHDAYTANIKTLEREIERRLDGVDHVQFDPNNPEIDYATQLQSILRRDPDIVLAGQVKDADVAAVAVEPGRDGPLIYVAQALPTLAEQIRHWVKLVGDVKAATSNLRCVTNQRLLRSLCPNCRQAYQPSAQQLKTMNVPAERVKQLYQASGKVQVKNKIENCQVCRGGGYLGLTAAFEVFFIDSEVRKILSSGDLKSALNHARRNKMYYLQEAAMAKVIAGETSLDEVVRVLSPAKSKPKPAPVAT
ncbi:MAG: GspE/PulE family protein [Planctomycetota bacterium]|jgi:general secretion pathway protein E